MLTSNWVLLNIVHSLDEVTAVAKSNGVCRNRVNNLKNSTKYSFKCCQYTLRNKLHLTSFLPKIELMLADWSKHSESNPFAICTPITSSTEISAYKWVTDLDRNSIHHWYGNFYVVPSSNAQMSSSSWLDIYISRRWLTFNDFLVWEQSCWLVVPLEACTCPVGLKVYSCKHSVCLGILFNLYQVSDKTRFQPLGIRKREGRPKKVNTAYNK